jgi:hypothetical protein
LCPGLESNGQTVRFLPWTLGVWYAWYKSGRSRQKVSYIMSTTTTNKLERGTPWVQQFAFHSGQHFVNLEHQTGYVDEKRRQAVADTEALIRFLNTFIETGDLAHLADYRGRLEVMLDEVDRGAWYYIVAGGTL